jgi:hypothetical protein
MIIPHAGDLLLCDGSCMRSFHVCNEEDGSGCNCLRMPDDLFQRVQVRSVSKHLKPI